MLNSSAERWHLCAACNASSDLLSRRPRVDVVSAGCVASHLVHAHVLLLHLQDTHQLRMLSKLLHARVDNASGSRSSSGVDQSPGPWSHPNMVLALRFVDVALRLRLVAARQTSSIHPTSRSHPARTQQRRRFCCRSRCRLLLLLTCLLLDARPALYCNCRLAIHVRASDFVLCLASSISTATPFPCACRTP